MSNAFSFYLARSIIVLNLMDLVPESQLADLHLPFLTNLLCKHFRTKRDAREKIQYSYSLFTCEWKA